MIDMVSKNVKSTSKVQHEPQPVVHPDVEAKEKREITKLK